jgi:hypothetical protein
VPASLEPLLSASDVVLQCCSNLCVLNTQKAEALCRVWRYIVSYGGRSPPNRLVVACSAAPNLSEFVHRGISACIQTHLVTTVSITPHMTPAELQIDLDNRVWEQVETAMRYGSCRAQVTHVLGRPVFIWTLLQAHAIAKCDWNAVGCRTA